MASDHLLRIGELSKRTGVSADLLRAWEQRYVCGAGPAARHRPRLGSGNRPRGGARLPAGRAARSCPDRVLGAGAVLLLAGDPIVEATRVTVLAWDDADAVELTA